MSRNLRCRHATAADADAIAAVFSRSYRLLTFLPVLHTLEEDRAFIADRIMPVCEVLVAEHADRIVSFLAREAELIRLLFTDPDFIGRGAGDRLLNAVKMNGPPVLELWCFRANVQARAFYEARAFSAVEFTDGRNNEERLPDVRYRWERAVDASRRTQRFSTK